MQLKLRAAPQPQLRNAPARARTRLAIVGCLLGLAGCSQPPAQTYRALVVAHSDPGVALPEVTVSHGDVVIGQTDGGGALPLRLSGAPGERVQLNVTCPPSYRRVGGPLEIVLRAIADTAPPPEYRAHCRPELRTLIVTVRANKGVGVPVRYLGREVARTDASGVAHALFKLPAGERVKLSLDTSSPKHRQLKPQNPEIELSVPDRDDVLLFDQPFVAIEPPRRAPAPISLPQPF